jgi:uncharacterized protein with PIN domain
MIVDTSALIAIALGEPSRERLLDALETAAGDCAVHALAESRDEPVLATGNDFAATDLPCYRL